MKAGCVPIRLIGREDNRWNPRLEISLRSTTDFGILLGAASLGAECLHSTGLDSQELIGKRPGSTDSMLD